MFRRKNSILPLSHGSYSFVVVRHLRHVGLTNFPLFFEVFNLLITWLSQPIEFIEWPECDELLGPRFSSYLPRSGYAGWGFNNLFQSVSIVSVIQVT